MADERISQIVHAGSVVKGTEQLEVSRPSTAISITATTISALASDNSFNDSGAGLIAAGFAVNMSAQVSGFGLEANNIYTGIITALTANKMTIGGTDGDVIVDEAAGNSVTITAWETRRLSADDITDRVNTSGDIKALIDANTGTLLCWLGGRLSNPRSGQIWLDKSGMGNNAVMIGATWDSANKQWTFDGTNDFGMIPSIGLPHLPSLDVWIVSAPVAAAAADTSSAIWWGWGYNLYQLSLQSSTVNLSGEMITIYAGKGSNAGRLGSNTYTRAANTLESLHSEFTSAGTKLRKNGSFVTLNLANIYSTTDDLTPIVIGDDLNIQEGTFFINKRGVGYSPGPANKVKEVIIATGLDDTTRTAINNKLNSAHGLS